MNLKATKNTVEQLCKKASEGMRKLLTKSLHKPQDPNGILSHLELKRTVTDDLITIETDFPDYAYYVEHGRGPGKRPPAQNLYEWCYKHMKSPSDKGAKTFSFLLARKIGREGTKPQPFLLPLQRMIELLSRTMEVSIAKDIENDIEKDIQKLNKDI